jgi:hypothetical protein
MRPAEGEGIFFIYNWILFCNTLPTHKANT